MFSSQRQRPYLFDGWCSATSSTVSGIDALVEAEDIEVSLLGMGNLRGSSEGGLECLGLSAQSSHPHPRASYVPEFLNIQAWHSWKLNQRFQVSGSPPSRHMEKLHFSIHWAWVGPCDKLWPMSYKQKVSLLSFCHHGANILNSGPSIYVLKWGPNKAEPSANPKQVYCICVRNKSLLC